MDLNFLPPQIKNALKNVPIEKVYELRLRTSFPVILNYSNISTYLNDDGISMFKDNAIICLDNDIEYIINTVTEHSLYAYNESIKRGYITTRSGIRIGLAGECVLVDGQVQTIKNFSSLNIRIPHQILGCAEKVFTHVLTYKFNNTLIISPPACGKTTILKDLVRLINLSPLTNSILVIDERGEFSCVDGEKIDKIKYSDKLYAFTCGIRTLAPQIIITDELSDENDWHCVMLASRSGAKIIATCHGETLGDITSKPYFINGIFDKYIILENKIFKGIINHVYDKDFHII